MNAKKEAEKQKRDKKLLYAKIKYILQDELKNNCNNLEDLNGLLYDEKLKDKIIDNTIEKLQAVLNYKYYSNEFLEDVNFYLLEIYNTIARQTVTIKTKQKKELERIEKEKATAEYKKQLLLQFEEIQKENKEKEKIKQQQKEAEKIENAIAWTCTIIFLIILFIII